MSVEEISDIERDILNEIKKRGLSPQEASQILSGLRSIDKTSYNGKRINFSGRHVKFGAISDMHIGHKCYRPDIMDAAARLFNKEGVEFVVNAGDSVEGMSGRDGHIYELTHIGATEQMDYFAEEMQKLDKWDIFSIEADGSHGGWFKSKGNMGLDVGKELEARANNYRFIGYDEQDIVLDNGLIIRLRHPGGGTAYAISYKMQKYVESLSGGKKPNVIVQGHFHKSNYLFYRNIHCFDAGCFQEQSPFMKKKGTPAHLGFWIIDAYLNRRGVQRLKQEFVPFYE